MRWLFVDSLEMPRLFFFCVLLHHIVASTVSHTSNCCRPRIEYNFHSSNHPQVRAALGEFTNKRWGHLGYLPSMMFDQRCSVQHTHRSTRITTSSIIFNPKLVKKYRPDSCWYHFRLISYARTLIVQRIWPLSHNLEVFPCSYSWEERTDQVHRSNSSSKLLVVMGASVTAVSLSKAHTFSKANQYSIRLVTGEGVAGDAHCGKTNQHVPAKAMGPKPNLRQVHIIHSELHDELQSAGFNVAAGQMGENITTRGVDVVKLPLGTRLHIGSTAVLEITGLRSTCSNLNKIQSGLLNAVQPRDQNGNIIRKAGVMCIVVRGAEVRPGDPIQVELPAYPHQALPVL